MAVAAAVGWWLSRTRPAVHQLTFTRLTEQPGAELYPSLSPDGKSFVYASRTSGNWDIYLQRVGSKNPINLTRDSPADDTEPAFSPDGEHIAFRSERDSGGIFVMGATGESVQRLVDFGYNPAWSPEGKQIVCSTAGFIGHSPENRYSANGRLFSVDVRAPYEKRLLSEKVKDAAQPHWSPHGDRIAYWGVAGGDWVISTIPAKGGEPAPVTRDPYIDWNPVWSPDGRYLYFASDRGGSMNLGRVRIEEKSGKVLGPVEAVTTPSPYSGHMSFSRDGR